MKKILSLVLIVIVSVSVICFTACGDTTDIEDRIGQIESSLSELTSKVNGINNPSAEELQEIKDNIESLRIAVGLLDPSSTDFDALLKRISDLEETLTGYDDLKNKVTLLEQTIAQNKQDAEQTISALTQHINTLESSLTDAEGEIASLKSQVETLAGTVITLSGTVQTLKELCESESTGNAALKTQIDILLSDISTLEGNISTLTSSVGTLTTKVGELETALSDAELRLELVEGAVGTDTNKVYNMGDVFTFRSASGLPMFRVRLIEFKSIGGTAYGLFFNIQRITIPLELNMGRFFTAYAYNEVTGDYYRNGGVTFTGDNNNFETQYTTTISPAITPPENITHFVVGMPSDNDLSAVDERRYIIPYAIYKLHSD